LLYLYINKLIQIMKLSEYLEHLNKVVKNNPKSLEFEVISSIDDEGNGYSPVFFHPTLGSWDGDDFETDIQPEEFNSICIN
jgi:hypothetical protein